MDEAMKHMKSGKLSGATGVVIETLKVPCESCLKFLTNIA